MLPTGDYLLYDGECPICAGFVKFAEFRRRHPDLQLLDARHEPGLVAELRRKGYEINDGMVLLVDAKLYYGADASAKLASYRSDLPATKRAAMAAIGASPYPVLRGLRNALLRIRGKAFID
ncbi:MAG: DCC1-like thiol-disulfide oxidoreductase family protein [Hyphomicrobiaceae bacterium]|nr:DCC1-like thiol-disulfide oxidoreductase family protein [Hyphomicrobiaceae bacterium]